MEFDLWPITIKDIIIFFSVLSFSGKIYKIILDFESGLGK